VNTIQRGNATEAAVLNAFIRADWHVWMPFGEGSACDLIVGWGHHLIRVQCKSGRVRNGCVVFNGHSTNHGRGRGSYHGRADVFGVSVPGSTEVFVIPVVEVPLNACSLRLTPTLNNQRRGVRLADPYRFENWEPEELVRRAEEATMVAGVL